jgi:hypothetical protein
MRTLMLFVALGVGLTRGPAPAEPMFSASQPIVVGKGSGTVLLADVNGDGQPDLITRHLLTRHATVRVGNGHGTFAPALAPLSFPYNPGDIALADFDNNGRLDLAVTPGDRDIVDVLRGDGRGGFARTSRSAYTVTTAIEPFNKRTLQVIDLNGDGNLDIVTANGRRRNTFGVLFGDGRGAFSRGGEVTLDSGRDGYSFAFGDVDGDGRMDVVSASRTQVNDDAEPGRLIVQHGDGKGRFAPTRQSPVHVPTGPRAVRLGDVDRDGRTDIVLLHQGGTVSILTNRGDGTFNVPSLPAIQLGADAFALSVIDVNGDAYLDLVAAAVSSVRVFLRVGNTYAPAPGSPYAAGPGAYNLTVGDVNRDGKPDVAATSFEGDAITLLLQR